MSSVVWSTELLRMLKAPETPANYRFLNQWATREHNGGPALSDGSNNPFFTTAGGSSTVGPFKSGSYPSWNSVGVATYPNLETGVYANAYHIATEYPAIRDALRSGNPASFANNPSFQSDLRKWSGSGYAGVSSIQAAAGPVGPTVDPGKIAKAILDGGSGVGDLAGKVGGALWGGAKHVPGVQQGADAVNATKDAGSAVAGFFGTITDPHNILRGLQIVAGAALVAIGGTLLARQVALAADLPDPLMLAGAAGGGAGRAVAATSTAVANRKGAKQAQSDREESAYYEGQAAGKRAKVDRLRLDRDADRGSRSQQDEIPF